MYKVFKVDDYGTYFIFEGSKIDATEVFEVLSAYHAYDLSVDITIEESKIIQPEYKNLDDFYKVPEFQYHLDDINKNKKYSAYCSDLGTKFFDTIGECDAFISKGVFGSLTEIRYKNSGELVESEIPF